MHLRGEPLDDAVTPAFLSSFAAKSNGLSGSDLFEICREAALRGLRDWLNANEETSQDKNEVKT